MGDEAVRKAEAHQPRPTGAVGIEKELGNRRAEPAGQDVLLDGDQELGAFGKVQDELAVERLG